MQDPPQKIILLSDITNLLSIKSDTEYSDFLIQ